MDGPAVGAAPERPRASAAAAIGVVFAISLVAAVGVVAWARLGAGTPSAAPPSVSGEQDVPATLADGSAPGPVPAALADEVEGPVIAATSLEQLPAGVSCGEGLPGGSEPELQHAVVTPDALLATLTTDDPETIRDMIGPLEDDERGRADQPVLISCSARWADGGWQPDGESWGPMLDMTRDAGVSWGGPDGGVQTASAVVQPPDGTAWVVQDRGAYRLAYPTLGAAPVVVSWRFRPTRFGDGQPPASPVTYHDADGTVLDEELIGV